ncbi:hypothetical protein QR680_014633 [Steinernema hermaphroditum]|uniref:C-type lectin domain-containing protein n=1 Tax=Steinernema hermaphroditum TaxID=289476 RepID=A0AA39M3K0_9BILA|nr:hypothetical protein QR680_014633 [Steinernema hermaphroditum]
MKLSLLFFSILLPCLLCQQWCGSNGVLLDDDSRCLNYYNDSVTFDAAQKFCASRKGNLTSDHGDLTNVILAQWNNGPYWIGGRDVFNNGTWSWLDGTPFDYSQWAAGQPSNKNGDDCLLYDPLTMLWSAADCNSKQHGYACYTPFTLPNAQPPPVECWGEYCYEATNLATWDIAEQYCLMGGGHLASIHSKEDIRLMEPIMASAGGGPFWIGGKVDSNLTLSWTDGSKVDFQNWERSNPMKGYGNCVFQSTDDMQWSTYHCDQVFWAICELPRRNFKKK